MLLAGHQPTVYVDTGEDDVRDHQNIPETLPITTPKLSDKQHQSIRVNNLAGFQGMKGKMGLLLYYHSSQPNSIS